MPHPIASTFASRFRRPLPDPAAPAVERPGRARRLWSLLPVALAFALFGAVVWLAYQDASLAPPIGEPPLIKAAADPFKLRPDETEQTTLSAEEGTVGRLWSDTEQVDQPERLLPRPEAPQSPPTLDEPATAATVEQPASAPAAEGESDAAAAATAAPAERSQSAAAPPASAESVREAEAALDRLLAEVTAISEDADAPAATAAAPAEIPEQRASIEPRTEQREAAPAEPAPARESTPTAAAPAAPAVAPAPADPAPAAPAAAPAPADPAPPAAAAAAPADPPPAPLPEVRPAGVTTAAPASAAPPRDGSTEIAAATAARATPRIPIVPDGDFRIQLAAVRGEADARRAWQLFMGDLGPVLADVEPIFERAETANGVFYRVQVGPFGSQEAAESLCEQLKQRNASCFVIRR